MWWDLENQIFAAAKRRIKEHETYAQAVHDENARRRRRSTGLPAQLQVRRPETWELDPGFNPYLVKSNHRRIAHSVSEQLKSGTYTPRRPAGFIVPKPYGGHRVVSTFQVADEVISNQLLRSLLSKNLPKLSARAYAYRPDIGPHDAIAYISSEFAREHRIYVAEFDFSKFFDHLSHSAIYETLDRMRIIRTPIEQQLIERFLRTPSPYTNAQEKLFKAEERDQGIPQGTSLSLFLANIAASELDRSLERLGVGFVRYADDTLIWSSNYAQLGEAVSELHSASQRLGSEINAKKSPGIRLLTSDATMYSEMSSTKRVDYLGHSLGLRNVEMKASSIARIKARISQLIYTNLLLEPSSNTQDVSRITNVDRDYVTLIWQLRRYLYGELTEKDVQKYLKGSIPAISFKGVMSFFPLVDNEEELMNLDNWIATQIWLALRKRSKLLSQQVSSLPNPHGLRKNELIEFSSRSPRTNNVVDLRIPSVRRINRVIQLAVSIHGLGSVSNASPLYLYSQDT